MATRIVMPQLGESVIEGTVRKWLVVEGDTVQQFDPILEVTTDKVDTEISAPDGGTVLKLLVTEDVTVQAGALLGWIGKPGEAVPEGDVIEAKLEAAPRAVAPVPNPAEQPLPANPSRDLRFISPVVAKLATEHNVNLSEVHGTGRGDRITKKDMLRFLASRPTEPDLVPALLIQEIELGPSRKAIAEHMVRSKRTSAHVTTVFEVNMSKVIAHREVHKAQFARDGGEPDLHDLLCHGKRRWSQSLPCGQ